MKNFILLFLLFLSVDCSVTRQVTPREQTKVEIRTETVYVPDTVFVELPQIVERIQTLDTVSVLENKYAVSEAFSGSQAGQRIGGHPERDCLS